MRRLILRRQASRDLLSFTIGIVSMRGLHPPPSSDGPSEWADRTTIAMAERICGRGSSVRSVGIALTISWRFCHLLGLYQRYYNDARTHLSLNKDAPVSRAVQGVGRIVPNPHLGGLHHQYARIPTGHSASPAFRKPSAYLARSSGRRKGK
jgi:hypothetical protein